MAQNHESESTEEKGFNKFFAGIQREISKQIDALRAEVRAKPASDNGATERARSAERRAEKAEEALAEAKKKAAKKKKKAKKAEKAKPTVRTA